MKIFKYHFQFLPLQESMLWNSGICYGMLLLLWLFLPPKSFSGLVFVLAIDHVFLSKMYMCNPVQMYIYTCICVITCKCICVMLLYFYFLYLHVEFIVKDCTVMNIYEFMVLLDEYWNKTVIHYINFIFVNRIFIS